MSEAFTFADNMLMYELWKAWIKPQQAEFRAIQGLQVCLTMKLKIIER